MMDEAFLRRIQTKIKMDFTNPEQFHEIFRRVCLQSSLSYDATVVDDLIQIINLEYKEPLRACYPRDLVRQILSSARYSEKEPSLNRETIAEACRNYFLAP